ncbi:MAG: hypothetical protein JW715_16160 [Sedimentisphaerales bacterium]|nr:hypothetical protein [Sedimentisphaerales bacterium]
MTIQFNCPNCNAVIGFEDKYSGKRAQCTTCGQRFIIPSKNFEKAEKVEPPEEHFEPLPGFYRAVFVDSLKLFIRFRNVTGMVFVTAAVCFKFFTGHVDYSFTMGYFRVQAPVGFVVSLASWGCLFWYYMEIICSTAIDVDELPDVGMGGFFGFIWNIVKSLFVFALMLVIVQLPCIIFITIENNSGFESPVVRFILSTAGLFIFPIAILTVSVTRSLTALFQPEYILKPVAKAFWPYLVTVALFVAAWQLQLTTIGYGRLIGSSRQVIGLHLGANLAVQALALIAMRSLGLFYRHYACNFPW